MMLRRAALSFDPVRGFFVDLPTYSMVPGTWQPVTANLIHADGAVQGADPVAVMALNPTVQVQLLDDFPVALTPVIIIAHIRHKYRGHARFDHDAWTPPGIT